MALTWWWQKAAEWTCRTAEHAEIPRDYGRRTVIAPRLCLSHGWKLPLTQAIKPLSAVWQPIHHVSFSRADHIRALHADDGNQCQNLFWRTNSELSLSRVCFGERRTAEPSSRTRTLGATAAKSWKSWVLGKKKDQLGRWQNSACGGPPLLERFTDNPQDTTSLEPPRHQQEVRRLILERVTVSVSGLGAWKEILVLGARLPLNIHIYWYIKAFFHEDWSWKDRTNGTQRAKSLSSPDIIYLLYHPGSNECCQKRHSLIRCQTLK